jgi:hypothetical protein
MEVGAKVRIEVSAEVRIATADEIRRTGSIAGVFRVFKVRVRSLANLKL